MSRLTPKDEVIRSLFALSGNCCAFPGCQNRLISDKGTFIAQLCHIEAANKGGQRYNEAQDDEQRRSAENLMLLCYEHHRETDDTIEFPVGKMQSMKKEHEEKCRGQYELPEKWVNKTIQSIEGYLDQLLAVAAATQASVHMIDEKINELLRRTTLSSSIDLGKYHIEQLDAIKDLKEKGKYQTAIELLIDFKEKNWDKLSPETKYKVLVNIGMTYLDLYDKSKACSYLLAIKDTGFRSADSLAMLCLGFAISGNLLEFDEYFPAAFNEGKQNINLWAAFIERFKNEKTAAELLASLPAEVKDSVPVLFGIGNKLIEEGAKDQGLLMLKKALLQKEDSPVKLAETKAMVATAMLRDLIDLQKFFYNNFSKEELDLFEQAKSLLSEAWQFIGDTELAKSKYYIVLNRGVINKVTGHNEQALQDFQKAYDLSHEFLPFKNLLLMRLNQNDLDIAKKLLDACGFPLPGNAEQEVEMARLKTRLMILQGNLQEAIDSMSALLDKNDQEQYVNTISHIIAVCIENKMWDDAQPWADKLINEFPDRMAGYLYAAFLAFKGDDQQKALAFYNKSASLVAADSPLSELYELAAGFADLHHYDKAIPIFERVVNKNLLNSFSEGLINAYYRSGDLQAALAVAENLFMLYPENAYLAGIITDIYMETKQYDKAIAIIEGIVSKLQGHQKQIFCFRCARFYAVKREWSMVRRYLSEITKPDKFSLTDVFVLSSLFIDAGLIEEGLLIAFEARTKYYDDSLAHVKYQGIGIKADNKKGDLFPDVVRVDTAVIIKIETGEEKTFLITDKNAKGENVLKPGDSFALVLLGKKKDQSFAIDKGFGMSSNIRVVSIMDIYTHAFQESMHLFTTRFAGQHNISVMQVRPGMPGDELEKFIKNNSLSNTQSDHQINESYQRRMLTIGSIGKLQNRNIVMQWFDMVGSQDISIFCHTQNESAESELALDNTNMIVLDITALLSVFFISKENNFLSLVNNQFIVSQCTIEELQKCYEELDRAATSGIFSLGYQDGKMAGHTVSKETIQAHRALLKEIIAWCRQNTRITVSSKLLAVKRDERVEMSSTLGDCFYDTMLLAKENDAAVICDDDNFKQLLRSEHKVATFSVYQLAVWLTDKQIITREVFTSFSTQLILFNHIFIPVTGEQIWECFDKAGFRLGKPFTVAVNGLLVMAGHNCAVHATRFLKKLYLHSGLASTKEQITLYILNVISGRPDWKQTRQTMILAIRKEFYLLPQEKDSLLQLLQAFV